MSYNHMISPSSPNKEDDATDENESFVQVMETDASEQETLSVTAEPLYDSKVMETDASEPETLSVTAEPLYDSIGLSSAKKSIQVCASVKACDLRMDDSVRAPVDIVVALDISASMQGDKLALCKKTLRLLLRELRPEDRFGLVTFSDEAVIEIPSRKLKRGVGRDAAQSKIDSLRVKSCTNISGGLGLALQEIQDIENPHAVRTIFLLTDGLANRGVTTSHGIVELVKGCIGPSSSVSPITIHTFGYGSDHDQSLLSDISRATPGGTYYFVNSDANVTSAFGDALGGVLSVVAQNVSITITVPDQARHRGVNVIDVYHDGKHLLENESWKVVLGDFYAEESRDVVFEIALGQPLLSSLPAFDNLDNMQHVQISICFMDTIRKKLCCSNSPVTVSILRPSGESLSAANPHVAVQWMRVCTADAMKKAEEKASTGDLSTARGLVQAQLEFLNRASTKVGVESDPLVVHLKSDLNRLLSGFVDRSRYHTYGKQFAAQSRQAHAMQRCNESDETKFSTYRTSMKMKGSLNFKKGSF